ncbi:glycoside hydrolase family 127 protein [Anaerophaga thermohalophila]|uniref:glycoside hydrolase family 127 protein n=1 Tax=Anaerophaga thermohalophila TaxID=177400 RepID=UPI000237BEED|nr:glycoside hydrolase family 127 protein [Anaerophaga thermohalophila]
MRRNFRIILTALISGCVLTGCSNPKPVQPDVEPFPLSFVRLLESPFRHAEALNEQYVMAHDPDRLLAPFLIDAGLEPKAPGYGNWESSGLNGHFGGHYLTSLSLMIASTGNEEARERLNYMIDELARCQEANGNGYVGGVPGGQDMWAEIAKGNIDAGNFSLNGKWVPLYNIHKLYAGLRDAWLYAGNEKAREILIKLTDWCIDLTAALSDDQIQEMLVSEHGGLNEVFADVYDITGDEKYLELARRFSHREILEPLLQHEDRLTGLHANTQIPKVIGYMRIAELTHDSAWIDASDFFWNTVVNNRTITIGGNSTHEHFHPVDDFSSMIESRQGPETCNTYNMLKLSKHLFLYKNDLKYIDYYEQALYNHILSSQHPGHGGLVYFTPMRPRHYRVYSNPEETFWCCVGSGIENHEKYGELIYAHDDEDVFVNLFIPSELNWKEKGLKLVQKNNFPDIEKSTLRVELDESDEFIVGIRCPAWANPGEMEVTVNGNSVNGEAVSGQYFLVSRKWDDGDVIEVHLPMHTFGKYLPDKSPYLSLMHGPFVLGAATDSTDLDGLIADDSRMGHIAHGPLYPLDEAPMLLIDGENWEKKVIPVDDQPMTFKALGLIVPDSEDDLVLEPFFRIHDARYIVYWRTGTSEEIDSIRSAISEHDSVMLALEKLTIDEVAAGEQQPESEHNFRGEGTETGVYMNRHWRHASQWFAYDLKDPEKEARVLRVTCFGGDTDRHFDILINDQKIAEVNLDGFQGDGFVDIDYQIPESVVKEATDGVLTVKFRAHGGSVAGGIYHVRLMRK